MAYTHQNRRIATPVSGSTSMASCRRRGGQAGIVLIQTIMAMGIIVICGAGALRAIVEMNRKAAAMRTQNQARAIVQRNIDTAMGASFTRDSIPSMLAFTTGATTTENIVVSHVGNNVIQGTLTRIVAAVSNPTDNADIRRVTYRLTYTYRTKPYNYEMSIIKATD